MLNKRNIIKRYLPFFIILIILIYLISSLNYIPEICSDLLLSQNKLNSLDKVYINWVYDGDTVRTNTGERIRFIGIDTQEMNWETGNIEHYAQEAFDFTKEYLLGKTVHLKYDQRKRDVYGRLLAYIFLEDGTFFNAKLLKKGYAHLLLIPPNEKYQELYLNLAAKARKEQIGLWNKINEKKEKLAVIDYTEAEYYLGQKVIVKGKITATYVTEEVTFLNFHEDYENNLSLVLFARNLNKFDYIPGEYLKEKEIKVLGEIGEYKGRLQIIVQDPFQILVIYKSSVKS